MPGVLEKHKEAQVTEMGLGVESRGSGAWWEWRWWGSLSYAEP